MRERIFGAVAAVTIMISGAAAWAGSHGGTGWTLDPASSTVAFGSVKKDSIGEVHNFERLSGTVDADGNVAISIDLGSVETWIDIRNSRIIEHVFANAPAAMMAAKIDMAGLADLAVGEMRAIDVKGNLRLGAADVPIQVEMIAVRLAPTRVMVVTAEMIWVSTQEAGIDDGITALMKLAKLPAITRTFPVTMRLVFDRKM